MWVHTFAVHDKNVTAKCHACGFARTPHTLSAVLLMLVNPRIRFYPDPGSLKYVGIIRRGPLPYVIFSRDLGGYYYSSRMGLDIVDTKIPRPLRSRNSITV